MCTLEIPKAVIKQIDKFRKNCLWRGNDVNGRGQPKAAWKLVCRTKEEGGLGIINLEAQNQALLMKNLDKFYNKRDIPWVKLVWEKHYNNGRLPGETKKGSFWWRDVLKLTHKFKEHAQVQVKNGKTCLFWKDQWSSQTLSEIFPHAHSFARNKLVTVHTAFTHEEFSDLFTLPLSQVAFQQLTSIQQKMNAITLEEQVNDTWTYFGTNSKFKSAGFYRKIMGHHIIDPAIKWMWRSPCQPKHKVFCWLLLNDRLSTRNILRRKGMALDSYNCAICLTDEEETAQHLFWNCPFAQQCWGILNLQTIQTGDTSENILAIKDQLNNQFFMTAVIMMCWTIWTARNELIFRSNQISMQESKRLFFKEINLVSIRVKERLTESFEQCIQSL